MTHAVYTHIDRFPTNNFIFSETATYINAGTLNKSETYVDAIPRTRSWGTHTHKTTLHNPL